MRTALSIAGSDSSGGAGVQADLKTMTMNGVFAMSAITALIAQNTTGVTGILEADPEFLKKQIDAVFEDIRPDAVKIGMVSSSGLIKTIAERLQHYKAENIVVDCNISNRFLYDFCSFFFCCIFNQYTHSLLLLFKHINAIPHTITDNNDPAGAAHPIGYKVSINHLEAK